MGCGASRDAVIVPATVTTSAVVPDEASVVVPEPVAAVTVPEVDSEEEEEEVLKAIRDEIATRSLTAAALGSPMVASAEECVVLNNLPECLTDLHDGMPPAIQNANMRLLKIKAVLSWKFLKVYEEVDPETECLQLPYVDTDDELWKKVVTVSWRWGEQKPAVYQKDFSPMSDAQFAEMTTLLQLAEAKEVEYVWIDWSCVPQYQEDSMVEVHRSKVFYARARTMRVLPTFRALPGEGPVRLILVKAGKVLKKRADDGSLRAAIAASIINAILKKNMVAGREYFGRVWTLAERMARFGRDEGLCQWLSLESWLGMVVDAMLKSTDDKAASVIYKKMLGTKAAGLLEAVLDPLSAAVRVGSVQARAAEGLETKVADLCMAAVSVWLAPSLLAEAPTSNWLHTYLGEEARSGVYQAWREADRVWAIYSYFCWKQNLDQRSAEGLRIALEDLVEIASGDRNIYVRGMFAQLGVDENATPVMEIVPQPGKAARPSSSRSTAARPSSGTTRPPSGRTLELEQRKKEEEEAAAAARERRRHEEELLTQSLERRRLEEEAAAAAATERRKHEEAAALAASERRKAEEAAAVAAATTRKTQEEAAAAAAAERKKLEEAAAAAATERKKAEEAAAAAALERQKAEERAAAIASGKVLPGDKVTIKYVSIDEAKAAQSGHGGWGDSMEKMLGKTGVVESVDKDGDVRVKMDDGSGNMLWNSSLVLRGTVAVTITHPSALSDKRIGRNAALNDKYTVRFVANSSDVGAVQADLPAPPSSLVYYFEITVMEPGIHGTIGLGYAHSGHNLSRHVGWDSTTYGFHGDDGKTFWEGKNEFYGFKYGKGDIVGAALDFQRKEIFFTKNGTKGKAVPLTGSGASAILYPTVSLHSSGEVVYVNFGQRPFSFNVDQWKIKVGDKVAIKSTSVDAAKAAQVGHGGWGSSMDQMLGKTGVVESIDKDGDVRVKMDSGSGSFLWNPVLVLPNAAAVSPFTSGVRVTIKKVPVEEARNAQSGHGGWASSMEGMLGKTGVVESVDKDGDVRVKMDDGSGNMLWNPSLLTLGGAAPAPAPAAAPAAAAPASSGTIAVGAKVTIKAVLVSEAKAAQSGHGGWADAMEKMMGMTGVVESIDKDGDIKVKMDDDGDSKLWAPSMVLPGVVMPTASLQVGGTATIKNVTADVAKKMQEGHGGWNDNMAKCLGKVGVVSYKYTDGDIKLKHEETGNNEYCWSYALVLPGGVKAAVAKPSPFAAGNKVTIKKVPVEEAKAAQSGHGGWAGSMEGMMGKTGVVESVDKDGDVRVKMDDGSGTMLWNPTLVVMGAAAPGGITVGAKVTIKAVLVSEAKAAQSGHGGWADAMEKMMGMTGVVESIDKDGDIKVKMDADGDSKLWAPSMVLPGVVMPTASLQVGSKATIKNVSVDEGKKMQEGHGGWNASMSKYLGKSGTVSYKYGDGDVKVKFEGGDEYCWSYTMVLPGAVEAAAPAPKPSAFAAGNKVTIKKVPVEEAKAAQSGHGGWAGSMEGMMGKTGVVESVDKDGDVRVKMDDGSGTMLWNPTLVVMGAAAPGGITVGAKVTIKAVTVEEAKAAQNGHGGWVPVMEKMMGMTGVVESIDKDGDIKVKMDDDGDSKLWAPSMVLLGKVMPTASLQVGSKAMLKNVTADVAKKMQEGHGGWNDNMAKCLGKVGVVSYKYTDGDVKMKHEETGNNEYCWSYALVLPAPAQVARSWDVGTTVMIKAVSADEAKKLQEGHGGWNSDMANYLGKTGTVSYKYTDHDMKVKFDGGKEFCWYWGLVELPSGGSTGGCTGGKHAGVWRGPETKYWCSTASMTEGPLCAHGATIIKSPHWSCCGATTQ